MNTFVAMIRLSWFVKAGLLALVVGAGLMLYSRTAALPERSQLQVAEGIVTTASKITKTSRKRGTTSITFELSVNTGAGDPLKLTIPAEEIIQQDVVSVIGKRIRAEYDAENDVYVLAGPGREIVTYENTLRRRGWALKDKGHMGMAAGGLGALLLLIGLPLAWRRLRREKLAAEVQPAT